MMNADSLIVTPFISVQMLDIAYRSFYLPWRTIAALTSKAVQNQVYFPFKNTKTSCLVLKWNAYLQCFRRTCWGVSWYLLTRDQRPGAQTWNTEPTTSKKHQRDRQFCIKILHNKVGPETNSWLFANTPYSEMFDIKMHFHPLWRWGSPKNNYRETEQSSCLILAHFSHLWQYHGQPISTLMLWAHIFLHCPCT